MNLIKILVIPFLILCFSCKNNSGHQYKTPAIFGEIKHIICTKDSTQQYEVYIPLDSSKKQFPVIFLFDSHADGKLAVTKFMEAAEMYGFILVGSDNSKNGATNIEYILKTLLEDALLNLPIDKNRQYAAGFSGGGRVAGMLALSSPDIKGIITCGAGFSPKQQSRNFDICGIAGKGDFNYGEVESTTEQLKNLGWNAISLFFNGGHEWPPVETCKNAVLWLQLNAMKQKLVETDEDFIDNLEDTFYQKTEQFIKTDQYIAAENECIMAISFLNGLQKTDKFKDKLEEIHSTEGYQNEKKNLEEINYLEQRLRQGYLQAFTSKNLDWWKNELQVLKSGIEQEKNTEKQQMLKRIKGFLGIVCYSYSNKAAMENNLKILETTVGIYEIVEPENADCYFYKSVLYKKQNKAEESKKYLSKAHELGFHDSQKEKALL